uniref:Uncharacterized protein n=1 Tax=viral metagenome TaxID=1070528 RepID=A0A6C0E0N4_9ZZZZ
MISIIDNEGIGGMRICPMPPLLSKVRLSVKMKVELMAFKQIFKFIVVEPALIMILFTLWVESLSEIPVSLSDTIYVHWFSDYLKFVLLREKFAAELAHAQDWVHLISFLEMFMGERLPLKYIREQFGKGDIDENMEALKEVKHQLDVFNGNGKNVPEQIMMRYLRLKTWILSALIHFNKNVSCENYKDFTYLIKNFYLFARLVHLLDHIKHRCAYIPHNINALEKIEHIDDKKLVLITQFLWRGEFRREFIKKTDSPFLLFTQLAEKIWNKLMNQHFSVIDGHQGTVSQILQSFGFGVDKEWCYSDLLFNCRWWPFEMEERLKRNLELKE